MLKEIIQKKNKKQMQPCLLEAITTPAFDCFALSGCLTQFSLIMLCPFLLVYSFLSLDSFFKYNLVLEWGRQGHWCHCLFISYVPLFGFCLGWDYILALFGTWEILRKENREENKEEKWKERK